MLSKDIIDEIAAENTIKAIEDAKELQAFIKGEQREGLLDVAVFRLNVLKSSSEPGVRSSEAKQGEQPGPLTQPTVDFKTGIQGTKDGGQGSGDKGPERVTGGDIVAAIDETNERRAQERERKDAEAEAAAGKAKAEAAGPRSYITGEDVIKDLRAKGHKI